MEQKLLPAPKFVQNAEEKTKNQFIKNGASGLSLSCLLLVQLRKVKWKTVRKFLLKTLPHLLFLLKQKMQHLWIPPKQKTLPKSKVLRKKTMKKKTLIFLIPQRHPRKSQNLKPILSPQNTNPPLKKLNLTAKLCICQKLEFTIS